MEPCPHRWKPSVIAETLKCCLLCAAVVPVEMTDAEARRFIDSARREIGGLRDRGRIKPKAGGVDCGVTYCVKPTMRLR